MEQLKIVGEIVGFDRVLYDSRAQWSNFVLSEIFNGSATFEAWVDEVDTPEKLSSAVASVLAKVERFILCVEWSYGHELTYTINNVETPTFASDEMLVEIQENLGVHDNATNEVAPRSIPQEIPQVPLEAKRWIHIWVESTKLSDYVEEQLRRQYLIIEELWQELHHIFNAQQMQEKRNVKLIRDFVSHAKCDNSNVVSLIKNDLPSAYEVVNGAECVRFKRTVEHRNFVSRFEVQSRQIARALVEEKMSQLGVVSSV